MSIPVAKLSGEIRNMLDDFNDTILDGIDAAADKAAKQCLKDIRANAKSKFNGTKYWKKWKRTRTSSRRGATSYTIYNEWPGLPHLLENGHAKVGGGRVSGKPHIAPAAEKAANGFEKDVETLIGG